MQQYLLPVAIGLVALWLLVFLPARRQQQKTRDLLTSLAPGKRVMLTSGIYGTVDTIDEEHQTIELEVSPEVYLSVTKRAVAEVFDDAEPDDEDESADSADE